MSFCALPYSFVLSKKTSAYKRFDTQELHSKFFSNTKKTSGNRSLLHACGLILKKIRSTHDNDIFLQNIFAYNINSYICT